jgi:hypothetical protein
MYCKQLYLLLDYYQKPQNSSWQMTSPCFLPTKESFCFIFSMGAKNPEGSRTTALDLSLLMEKNLGLVS